MARAMLDLTDPTRNLDAFVRTRASLGPEDTVTWWTGAIHAQIPGDEYQRLFRFEGFNVGRIVTVDGGYRFLAREAAFYQDLRTGDILETWSNPFTGKDCPVLHVWNDPVNFEFLLDGPRGPWRAPVTEIGDDVMWPQDILLGYPSPLPMARYPDNSADDTYRAAELFQFFCRRSDLETDLQSIPCRFSWTRLCPWLPWMEMGARPGGLVYHCHGVKLGAGYRDLPEKVRSYVAGHNPAYERSPEAWSTPNETSWTYFRRMSASE